MGNDKWFTKKLFYHMPDKTDKEGELLEINSTEGPIPSTHSDTSIIVENIECEPVRDDIQIQRLTWVI